MEKKKDIRITNADNAIQVEGALTLGNFEKARALFDKALKENSSVKTIDLKSLQRLDTAGALLLKEIVDKSNAKIINLQQSHQALLSLLDDAPTEIPVSPKKPNVTVMVVNHVGKLSVKMADDSKELISFLGQACVALFKAFLHPSTLRFGTIVHHIEAIGIKSIPIISLIAFLISVVLAYQGVAQLRPLGAQQFTVNLVAISVLREMGVLLTAIMVAGRSGSAFTAEIGVMKVREEIDALRTIGIKPFEILVVPRLIALIICMPLLTFIADIMGLLGGALLSMSLIDISFNEYVQRVQTVIKTKTFFVGLVKAPVFALAIGIVGCMHGMKVSGSAESVGKETTASVVKSIFLVLILDAVFSILFNRLGV